MRERRSISTGVGVGGSSILVIFILLCLTTFATLSMVSASADLRLTDKTVATMQEYYQADAQAEEILSRIDGTLREQRTDLPTTEYLVQCAIAVVQQVPEAEAQPLPDDGLLVRYSVPVNEYQELLVALWVQPETRGARFTRQEWRLVTIDEWEPESGGLNLWGGNEGGLLEGEGGLPISADGLPFNLEE